MFNVIAKVANSDKIENGAFLHLTSPTQLTDEEDADPGEPLYADAPKNLLPCRAKVRSYRSTSYRSKEFSAQTRLMGKARRAKGKEGDLMLEAAAKAERPRRFATLLAGLENCDTDTPGYIPLTEEQALVLANDPAYQWLVDQVMDFAYDDSKYGGAAETAPPAPAAGAKASKA